MADICNVTPPAWVTKSTYIEEDLAGGVFKSWWHPEFKNTWSIDNTSDTVRGHVFAFREGVIGETSRLTPVNTPISGDFILEATVLYTASFLDNLQIVVKKVSDDSEICDIRLENSSIQWFYSLAPTLIQTLNTPNVAYDQFRVKIVREGGVIYARWFDDFTVGDGTGSYDWAASPWTAPVADAFDGDVYIVVNKSTTTGISRLRLEADSGFPCLLTPNAVENSIVSNKCYHYGFNDNQGVGWSDIVDGDWIWISNPAQSETVIDSNGYRRLIAQARETGLFYQINVYDGPSGSGFIWRNKDRVDPNIDGSGTDIGGLVKVREYMGDMQHYTFDHNETHIHVRPRVPDNRTTTLPLEYPSESFQTLAVAVQYGDLYKALNRDRIPNIGEQFTVYGTGGANGNAFDFTGGEMETAKGSEPFEGDIFQITNNVSGSESISYVGVGIYTNLGLMIGQQFDAKLYVDGSETPSAVASDIPHDREIVFDRKAPGHTQQVEVVTSKSDWRIINFELYFTVYDVPQFPKKNSRRNKLQSTVHEEALSTPWMWISRNHSRPLINRSTGRVAIGTVDSTAVGPDGENSAIIVTAP